MQLTIIGEHPLAKDDEGKLKCRIGSLFTDDATLVTLPRMTHAMQRLFYLGKLNKDRAARGEKPLDELSLPDDIEDAVDLIMENDCILIRPDPSRMDLAFKADEMLQTLPGVNKLRIRFLHARNASVQKAIRARGEYWRISPRPQSEADIISFIRRSRIAIENLPLYYYSPATGTRYLTLQNFAELSKLPEAAFRRQLIEIKTYTKRWNRLHNPEVAFFGLVQPVPDLFDACDFANAPLPVLHMDHARTAALLADATDYALRQDDVTNPIWRNHLFACLTDERNETLSEVLVSGLTEEFFRQIHWLPGGCVQNDELIFDTIFDDLKTHPDDPELKRICDPRVKGFIFNYIREFAKLEYINIGRLLPGLRKHPEKGAHRAYIVEVKNRDADKPDLRILRMQRWGIKEHLAEHNDLLRAIMETQDYTEYTLDRRLGCWELGLPVPPRQGLRILPEDYSWAGTTGVSRIWTPYFERDFIDGLATDKIPESRLRDPQFATALARLLGGAAAPNLVVGRISEERKIIFDSGDEILLMDQTGRPSQILTADHSGTFVDYTSPLVTFAEGYARPVLSRLGKVPDPAFFAKTYLDAMEEKLREMQGKYRLARHAFDTLFQHSKQGPGTFSDRWASALKRLRETDVGQVIGAIRSCIAKQIPGL